MAQQQQQGWANTAPWMFFAVAVLTACLGGMLTGLVPASSVPLMIGVLLACSLPQLLGAIIHFRRGEILLATIGGSFGTVITLGAAFTMWIQIFKAPAPGAFTGEIMGFFWITLFIITEVFAIGFGRMSWFVLAGVAEVGVMFLLLGLFSLLGVPVLSLIAGIFSLVFAAFCIYVASAVVLGEHFQRPMLPIGHPVFK
jgi:succinate-acetate transporter protein